MNKQLIIIRGVMGSGKTTLAKLILGGMDPLSMSSNWVHFEADMFFIDPLSGEYKWEGEKIGQAHRWCEHMINNSMEKGKNIIVSNTFVKKKEYQVYEEMALKHAYSTQILICQGRFQNIHGIPEEKVQKKRQEFEY